MHLKPRAPAKVPVLTHTLEQEDADGAVVERRAHTALSTGASPLAARLLQLGDGKSTSSPPWWVDPGVGTRADAWNETFTDAWTFAFVPPLPLDAPGPDLEAWARECIDAAAQLVAAIARAG